MGYESGVVEYWFYCRCEDNVDRVEEAEYEVGQILSHRTEADVLLLDAVVTGRGRWGVFCYCRYVLLSPFTAWVLCLF